METVGGKWHDKLQQAQGTRSQEPEALVAAWPTTSTVISPHVIGTSVSSSVKWSSPGCPGHSSESHWAALKLGEQLALHPKRLHVCLGSPLLGKLICSHNSHMPDWKAPRVQPANHKDKASCLCTQEVFLGKGIAELFLPGLGDFSPTCQSDTSHSQTPKSPLRLFHHFLLQGQVSVMPSGQGCSSSHSPSFLTCAPCKPQFHQHATALSLLGWYTQP